MLYYDKPKISSYEIFAFHFSFWSKILKIKRKKENSGTKKKKNERKRVQTCGNNSEQISYVLTHKNRMESVFHIDPGVYS